jgi:hypothetical protein
LAVDRDENLDVVDSLNNRMQQFSKDNTFIAEWGTAGSHNGEFKMPRGQTLTPGPCAHN